jgi:dephospho-CoA kinase
MTPALFETLKARQMPDADKRARASHILETLDLPTAQAYVTALVAYLRSVHA